MSKKDKSKFKKLIKAQMLQDMAQAQKEITPDKHSKVIVSNPNISVAPAASIAPSSIGEINLPQIKYDLKKTGIVVGSLVAVMVGLYFLDLKYGLLVHFGNWLFKVLHIQ